MNLTLSLNFFVCLLYFLSSDLKFYEFIKADRSAYWQHHYSSEMTGLAYCWNTPWTRSKFHSIHWSVLWDYACPPDDDLVCLNFAKEDINSVIFGFHLCLPNWQNKNSLISSSLTFSSINCFATPVLRTGVNHFK